VNVNGEYQAEGLTQLHLSVKNFAPAQASEFYEAQAPHSPRDLATQSAIAHSSDISITNFSDGMRSFIGIRLTQANPSAGEKPSSVN